MNEVVAELLVTGPMTVDSYGGPAAVVDADEPGGEYQLFVVVAMLTSLRQLRATYRFAGPLGLVERLYGYVVENAVGYSWALRYRWSATGSSADLPAVVEIDAAELQYQSRFSKAHFPTKDSDTARSPIHDDPVVGVVGGRWDLFRIPWEATRIYRSFEARFVDGADWDETEKYRFAACKIACGLEDWRATTPAELDRRCVDLDALYESMAEEGYVPQTELLERGDETMETVDAAMKPILGTEFPHEMRVGIGREGEIIRFSAGKHRLSIAKLLGLEDVPVVVVVRHEEWARIRRVFEAADSLADVPLPYQRFADHPDLRAVTRWNTSTTDEDPSRVR